MKHAVCVLITNDKGQVVLATRRFKTTVGLPGGKVEDGETHKDAAIREVFEETGVELDICNIHPIYRAVCYGDENYDTICYSVSYSGEIPGGNEEGIESYWGNVSELLTNSPFSEYNKEVIKAKIA